MGAGEKKLREAKGPERSHTAGKGSVCLEIQALGESQGALSNPWADPPLRLFSSYRKIFFLWNTLMRSTCSSRSEIVTVIISCAL